MAVIESSLLPSYRNPPRHYDQLAERIRTSTGQCRGNPDDEKVFIAANFVNEKTVRGPWGESLRELVDILGRYNVFVSIYGNDGKEGTRDALRELQDKLPCSYTTPNYVVSTPSTCTWP